MKNKSKKNSVKSNNKLLIILVPIALILLWLGFKVFMLTICSFNEPIDAEGVVKGLKNQSEITVTKHELSDSEYFTIGKLKIKNILDGYKDENPDDNVFLYKKEVDGKTYAFQFGSELEEDMTLTTAFNADNKDIDFYGEADSFLKIFYLADRKGFLKDNNINNDIDFYKFVADNYVIKNSIFTSTKKMMQNYAFNYFVSIAVPKVNGMIVIKGDIEGYIFTLKGDLDLYQITVLDNGKQYGFITTDPRFNNIEFMKDYIGSIKIDK